MPGQPKADLSSSLATKSLKFENIFDGFYVLFGIPIADMPGRFRFTPFPPDFEWKESPQLCQL